MGNGAKGHNAEVVRRPLNDSFIANVGNRHPSHPVAIMFEEFVERI